MKIPCKFLGAAAIIAATTLSVQAQVYANDAQNAYTADSYYTAASPFEGVYAGIYTGARFNPGTAAMLGVVAGANFALMENFTVGVEGQGGANFGAPWSYDALMLGHFGYEINNQAMIYGALGGGVVNGVGSYAAGIGADVMVVDQISVRGEILGTGPWGGGMNGAKASIGALWHLR